MTKILIDLGEYDETPTIAQALADAHDLISTWPHDAALNSVLVED